MAEGLLGRLGGRGHAGKDQEFEVKLSDEDLLIAYQRAILDSAGRLLRKVGPELVSRPGIKGKVDFADVYELMSRLSGNSDEAIEYIRKAQEAALNEAQEAFPEAGWSANTARCIAEPARDPA